MRGCGTLSHDSLYHTWPLGTRGIPITSTIMCPTWELDRQKMGLSYQGINLRERIDPRDGSYFLNPVTKKVVFDVYDIVGAKFYNFIYDFWYEGTQMGFNRKLAKNTNVELLDKTYSRWFICHDKAVIDKRDLPGVIARWQHFDDEGWHHNCDRHGPKHANIQNDNPDATCNKYWSFMPSLSDCEEHDDAYWRTLPCGSYHVHPGDKPLRYKFGAFLSLPIGRFTATTPRGEPNLSKKAQVPVDKLRNMGFRVDTMNLTSTMP